MEITGKAVRIYETGGPEVLKYEDVSFNKPKNNEVRLKHHAIGLNFIDINKIISFFSCHFIFGSTFGWTITALISFLVSFNDFIRAHPTNDIPINNIITGIKPSLINAFLFIAL